MNRLLYWSLVAVTLGVYAVMVTWSLPRISAAADGLAPFDLRPTGYTFEEARAFLAALTADGSAFYRRVQHGFDLFYPALLATVLVWSIFALSPGHPAWLGWVLAATAVPGAIFDYLENNAVERLLLAGAEGLTADMAETASRWTVLKSASSALSMSILLVLVAAWLVRWRRSPTGG